MNNFLHTTTTSCLAYYATELHCSRLNFYELTTQTQVLAPCIHCNTSSCTSLSHNLIHKSVMDPSHQPTDHSTSPFPSMQLLWNEGILWSGSTLHQTAAIYLSLRNILLKCIYIMLRAYQNYRGYCHKQSTHLSLEIIAVKRVAYRILFLK
jgi:hypothetical protein